MAKTYSRKQVTFDLTTTENGLQKYYPTSNWRNAYEDIKQHMTQQGFSWRQGSVYHSIKGMHYEQVSEILADLVEKHTWLNKCMRDCVITNIGKEFNMSHLFSPYVDVKTRDELQAEQVKSIQSPTQSNINKISLTKTKDNQNDDEYTR